MLVAVTTPLFVAPPSREINVTSTAESLGLTTNKDERKFVFADAWRSNVRPPLDTPVEMLGSSEALSIWLAKARIG